MYVGLLQLYGTRQSTGTRACQLNVYRIHSQTTFPTTKTSRETS